MTIDFQELMVEIQNGNPMAFEELYNHVRPKIAAFLFQLGSRTNDVEDLLQETMFRVWERCQQYDSTQGNVMTWIARIARNQWVDLCRRRGRKSRGGSESFVEFPLDDLKDDSETRNAAVYPALKAAIKKLPREMKVVCNGTLAGQSARQIARRRGYTGSKASRLLREAKQRLATSATLQDLNDR